MSTPPRRRRPDARRSSSEGGGWFPTIAMGLGVVIAGLGIGALVAILMQRNLTKLPPLASVTSTSAPTLAPQRPAVAIATIAAPRTPRPTPAPLTPVPATPTALVPPPPNPPPPTPTTPETVVPVVAVTEAPTPVPTPVHTPVPVRTAIPAPLPAAAVETAAPVRVAAVSPAPAPSRTPTPAPPSPTPTPAPAPTTPAPISSAPPTATEMSAYDQHASAVVRRYLDALIRGDVQSAQSVLGANAGTLAEQAFLDPGARIVSLKVTRIDAANASVGCEIAAVKGHYYATYHIAAGTGGPYISEHDYIKV